ncbi:MAG: hypothetical protein M5U34_31395 [Chloroflexi bacterium]|nr:hypothetical protein [Chloroflexota bacterium]
MPPLKRAAPTPKADIHLNRQQMLASIPVADFPAHIGAEITVGGRVGQYTAELSQGLRSP